MKPASLFIVILAIAGAAAGGYFYGHQPKSEAASATTGSNGRKVLFYQSPMHPWIKSDKPGKCTICGMTLVPVYEGEKGVEMDSGTVTLGSNMVQVIHVQSAPATMQPLQRSFRFAGTIEDDDTRHRILSAYVKGRIDELFVNYIGAEVKEGQPLASFYSPTLLSSEREYVALARSPRENVDYQRLLAASKLRLTQYGLTEKQVTALPDKPADEIHSQLLAPMSGTVVARKVYAGQYVMEGEKLFEIADFSTMWLQFDAYEQDLAWLKPGQEVEVTTPAVPDKVFKARITFIDPNLNMMTRSAKVRVEIPNPLVEENGKTHRELSYRLYAEARVQVASTPVLTVPRSAVLMPDSQRPLVYVDKGGNAYEKRSVKLGRSADGAWEILDGIKEGELVVTQGNLMIDAQAQLNQSANLGSQAQGTNTSMKMPAHPPLTAGQTKALEAMVDFADALSTALAADKLDGFNKAAPQGADVVKAMTGEFANAAAWKSLAQPVIDSATMSEAKDIAAARKSFHTFSMAATELVRHARMADPQLAVKVFKCPMAGNAVPGVPKEGYWLQKQLPLRNPYFGAEMIDCGSEVKP